MMMGLGKPQLHAKFEVTGFIYYGNIREFLNNKFAFLSYFLGKLGVTSDFIYSLLEKA